MVVVVVAAVATDVVDPAAVVVDVGVLLGRSGAVVVVARADVDGSSGGSTSTIDPVELTVASTLGSLNEVADSTGSVRLAGDAVWNRPDLLPSSLVVDR